MKYPYLYKKIEKITILYRQLFLVLHSMNICDIFYRNISVSLKPMFYISEFLPFHEFSYELRLTL